MYWPSHVAIDLTGLHGDNEAFLTEFDRDFTWMAQLAP
jgi:hypothetical protein